MKYIPSIEQPIDKTSKGNYQKRSLKIEYYRHQFRVLVSQTRLPISYFLMYVLDLTDSTTFTTR